MVSREVFLALYNHLCISGSPLWEKPVEAETLDPSAVTLRNRQTVGKLSSFVVSWPLSLWCPYRVAMATKLGTASFGEGGVILGREIHHWISVYLRLGLYIPQKLRNKEIKEEKRKERKEKKMELKAWRQVWRREIKDDTATPTLSCNPSQI